MPVYAGAIARLFYRFDHTDPARTNEVHYRYLAGELCRRRRGEFEGSDSDEEENAGGGAVGAADDASDAASDEYDFRQSCAARVCDFISDWLYNRPDVVVKWLKFATIFFQVIVSISGGEWSLEVPSSAYELGWQLWAALPQFHPSVGFCATSILLVAMGNEEKDAAMRAAEAKAFREAIAEAEAQDMDGAETADAGEARVSWQAKFRRRLITIFANDLRTAIEPRFSNELTQFATFFDGGAAGAGEDEVSLVPRLMMLRIGLPRIVRSAWARMHNGTDVIAKQAFDELACSDLLEPCLEFTRVVFARGPGRKIAYSLLSSTVVISDLQFNERAARPIELGIIELAVWMTTAPSYLGLAKDLAESVLRGLPSISRSS